MHVSRAADKTLLLWTCRSRRAPRFAGEVTAISHSWEICEKHSSCATCYWQLNEKQFRSGALRACPQAAYLEKNKDLCAGYAADDSLKPFTSRRVHFFFFHLLHLSAASLPANVSDIICCCCVISEESHRMVAIKCR